jgi:hypothetical protein
VFVATGDSPRTYWNYFLPSGPESDAALEAIDADFLKLPAERVRYWWHESGWAFRSPRRHRFDLAYRYNVRNYLRDELRLSEPVANQWCDSWEKEARARRLTPDADFWRLGLAWVLDEQAAGRKPLDL